MKSKLRSVDSKLGLNRASAQPQDLERLLFR